MSDANILLVPRSSGVCAVSQVLLGLSCSKFNSAHYLTVADSSGLGQDLHLGLAVLDPQLVGSFQGLFTGVIEYVWKIRVVVSRTSRGTFPACTHCLWQSHSSL